MTAEITATIQIDPARIAHRKACAYLKGFIVGYALNAGMKWGGDPDRTPEFREGFDQGGSGRCGAAGVTYAHIVYNRLRHGRPHLTSGKVGDPEDTSPNRFDNYHDLWMRWERTAWTVAFDEHIVDYGVEVKEVLS